MRALTIPEALRIRIRPGTRVQVCICSGLDSGRTGVVVDATRPEYRPYIAIGCDGRYKPFNFRTEALVRTDNGQFFTMFKDRLVKPRV